jgi:hypothetical protein
MFQPSWGLLHVQQQQQQQASPEHLPHCCHHLLLLLLLSPVICPLIRHRCRHMLSQQ